jgi:hypothetical protein
VKEKKKRERSTGAPWFERKRNVHAPAGSVNLPAPTHLLVHTEKVLDKQVEKEREREIKKKRVEKHVAE